MKESWQGKEYQRNEVLDIYTRELVRQTEAKGLLQAPAHMKQEILERSRRVDYQLALRSRKLSGNTRLLFYSLKVGAAMATALFLLFAVPGELPQSGYRQLQQEELPLGTRVNAGLSEIDRLLTDFVRGDYNRN